MILPGEHVVLFGLPGSGKTTLTRKIGNFFRRKIVFDRLGEWCDAEYIYAADYESFKSIYRDSTLQDWSDFTIVIRPRAGMDADALISLTDQVLALVYSVENERREGIAVIFEEIWLYVPQHGVSAWMYEVLLTGRHPKISLIGNAQRPAIVSKTLISMAKHVFVGNFFEANDKKYYREVLGDHPAVENPPKKHEFWWFKPTHEPLSAAILVSS